MISDSPHSRGGFVPLLLSGVAAMLLAGLLSTRCEVIDVEEKMVLYSNKPNTSFWFRPQRQHQDPDAGWKLLGKAEERTGGGLYKLQVTLLMGRRCELKAESPEYQTKHVRLTEPIAEYRFRFYESDRNPGAVASGAPTSVEAPTPRPAPASQPVKTGKGQRWALVVGISKYKDSSIPEIPNAAKDARAVRDFLVDPKGGGFETDHVSLLVDFDATSRKLERHLKSELRRKVQSEDDLFLYFACHGMAVPSPKAGSEDGLEKYLIPYDAVAGDVDVDGISMSELDGYLDDIDCRQVAMVLDTCFSGGARSISTGPATRNTTISSSFLAKLGRQEGAKRRTILTACSANELAQDDPDTGHGLFTTYFLEGLTQAEDADGNGSIALYEVFTYLTRKVRERSAEIGQRQNPNFVGDPAYPFRMR